MNPLRMAAVFLALIACSSVHAMEPLPNMTVVCEVQNSAEIKDAGPSRKAPPITVLALTAKNGVRCKTEGPQGVLDYFPIFSEDQTQITLSGTASFRGGQASIEMTNPPDDLQSLGVVHAEGDSLEKEIVLQHSPQSTRAPSSFELSDKVTISCERITMPVATAAGLLKSEKGRIDTRSILNLARLMIRQDKAESRIQVEGGEVESKTIGPRRIPYGQMEKVTEGDCALMVDPQVSEDRKWLTISLHLRTGKSEIVSTLDVKQGDSVFAGTLECNKPGYVTLVFSIPRPRHDHFPSGTGRSLHGAFCGGTRSHRRLPPTVGKPSLFDSGGCCVSRCGDAGGNGDSPLGHHPDSHPSAGRDSFSPEPRLDRETCSTYLHQYASTPFSDFGRAISLADDTLSGRVYLAGSESFSRMAGHARPAQSGSGFFIARHFDRRLPHSRANLRRNPGTSPFRMPAPRHSPSR